MYAKYLNCKAKRPKLSSTTESTKSTEPSDFDISISTALKNELKRDFADWSAVADKWQKTFCLRQKELGDKKLNINNFLLEWPKYADGRAAELVSFHLESKSQNYVNFLFHTTRFKLTLSCCILARTIYFFRSGRTSSRQSNNITRQTF